MILRTTLLSLAVLALPMQGALAAEKKAAPKKQGNGAAPASSESVKPTVVGDANAKKGGTLVYEAYEPSSLNPINYKEQGAMEILEKWAFESLLDNDVVSGEYIPWLAKSWEISADGKEFTFTLDERAKWFDGKPVTAEDVVFSFEVFKMDGANAPFKKQKLDAFSKIEIVKPGVVKFTASERVFSNFEFLAGTLILPKHVFYSTDPQKLEKNEAYKAPKGSGPYVIEKWEKGNQAVLKRNPNYWGSVLPQNQGANNFDQIVIKYVRDPQIAFEMFKKGELDYMPIRIGNTQLWRQTKTTDSFVKGDLKAVEVQNKAQQGYGFIGFNTKNELFSDKRVRKALAMAVDRNELISKTLDGLAVIPKGPLFSLSNFEGKFEPVAFDAKKAAADLAAAGWKDSDNDYILDKGGKKFEFTVIVPNARIEKELLFIQSYWKKIGVKANIKILEYSTWLQLQNERKFEALANGRTRSLFARSVDAYSEWHSENAKPGLSNYYGFANPEADKLIMEARQEMNARKRKVLLNQVNDIVAEDYPIFQYSESKQSMFVVNSKVSVPGYQGKMYYPYAYGEKYWFKK